MAIEPFPEPFDEQGDLEQQLRDRLATLDEQRASDLAVAEAAISAAQTALSTAGNEYNQQVEDAQSGLGTAVSGYEDFLDETTKNLEDAQDAIDAIGDIDAQDEIDAIPSVTSPTVLPTETPDCAVIDVNNAFGSLTTEINAVRDAVVVVLQIFQDAGSGKAKEALQKLKDVGQGFRDQMPAAEDVEAEKAAKHAELENLYP
jgi:hypothetical protein